MVLVSSGWCFLLMAPFYWAVDYKGYRKHTNWLKIYGTNSIVAYMLFSCIDFDGVSHSLLFGLKPYVGNFYPALIAAADAIIIYQILRQLYHKQIFLKV